MISAQKIHKTPRISVNKLGEYMVSKAKRQQDILKDQKYPSDFMTIRYSDAQEAISQFIAGSMEDITLLERKIKLLQQSPVKSEWSERNVKLNIDAIEGFMNAIDSIDLKKATPKLGNPFPQKMQVNNVDISVRPEIILSAAGTKGKRLVGGIKLHFPKTHNLEKTACEYVATMMQMYCGDYLFDEGVPHPDYVIVIDVPSGYVCSGVTATASKKKDVQASCEQIANLWPTVKKSN